ncbi:hypothetical protein JOD63_000147 [Microbacterium terrae]|uniref:HNH nuclease domain-containing protein n=1 Tax=Microbacterium terrae TaxID=69369 RepID=A0A0M2GYB0_9MICO|nr:HNH endonuclease signature motif containing protein [Microbacterium terrae]KJL38760.1 hypothetical protein RS81_02555 [Microbacterium terrae]MBP1076179.1 hypothetical protein [Microbacterium terrae]GLJ96999.1 hypothetical protein GCM10017594_01960 [Microbacterium terrae]
MDNGAGTLIEQLSALDRAAAEVLSTPLANDVARSVTDADSIALARVIEQLGRRIDAARLLVAGEIDDRSRADRGAARLCTRLGCANATEALVRATGIAATSATSRLRAARTIATTTALSGETVPARWPLLRDALISGSIGSDTVAAVATTLDPIADRCHPTDIAAAESELVGAAIGGGASGGAADDAPACTADETRLQARVWALALDPDGVLPDYERAARRRFLRVGREREGLVPVTGALLPDVAAQLDRLLHAQLSPRTSGAAAGSSSGSDSGSNESRCETGVRSGSGSNGSQSDAGVRFSDPADDPASVVPLDIRTRQQKQHDALAAILGVAARSAEMPSIGGAAPTLLVTISARDLARDEGGVAIIDGTDTVVPAYVARQIACCGGIQRLVFSDDGRIVELGSPQRVFTAHQRRAITARDGGCIIPGCRIPAAWCEIHHVEEHSRGGPTHTDNGVMLCWHHHRTLETSGWKVRIVDGLPETRAPNWIDPYRRWRPARGSTHLEIEKLRRRRRAG